MMTMVIIDKGATHTNIKKILIIDDEANFCRVIKKSIELGGRFHVSIATNGNNGIALAKKQRPDLILLDIMMPELSGIEVAEQLLDDPDTTAIPIIFVTSIVKKDEVKKKGGISGGRTFLAKPVNVDELIKKINACLVDS